VRRGAKKACGRAPQPGARPCRSRSGCGGARCAARPPLACSSPHRAGAGPPRRANSGPPVRRARALRFGPRGPRAHGASHERPPDLRRRGRAGPSDTGAARNDANTSACGAGEDAGAKNDREENRAAAVWPALKAQAGDTSENQDEDAAEENAPRGAAEAARSAEVQAGSNLLLASPNGRRVLPGDFPSERQAALPDAGRPSAARAPAPDPIHPGPIPLDRASCHQRRACRSHRGLHVRGRPRLTWSRVQRT
jgi:hypothetical protein